MSTESLTICFNTEHVVSSLHNPVKQFTADGNVNCVLIALLNDCWLMCVTALAAKLPAWNWFATVSTGSVSRR